MAFVFFIFGLIISSISIFLEFSALFYLISGLILVILGINVFKPLKELINIQRERTDNVKMIEKGQKLFFNLSEKSVYLGAFFLGILFSIGWAPCAISLMMPVFVLMLSQKIPILIGGLMLFIFGLGHGIPIIPLCAVKCFYRCRWPPLSLQILPLLHQGLPLAVRFVYAYPWESFCEYREGSILFLVSQPSILSHLLIRIIASINP